MVSFNNHEGITVSNSILKLQKVIEITRLSRASVYDLISQRKFPKQIKLSVRASGWLESEVNEWIDDRIAERDGKDC